MKNCIIALLFLICFSIKAENEKIILIGDTQRTLWFEFWREQNVEIRKIIFPKIVSEKPKALIILGDLSSWGASESDWEYFDSITNIVKINNIPIYPVIGNHDYFGSNETALNNFQKRFPFFGYNTWFANQINSIGFVYLNSNLSELTKAERAKQIQYLDSTLNLFQKTNTISNIVISWHHPIHTNSSIVDDDIEVSKEFIPIINQYPKVRLIASGHCHSYEHFKENGIHYLVSGGAGGPRQELLNKNESRHQDLFDGKQIRDFHYCILEIINSKIQIRVVAYDEVNKNWKEIDKWLAE